MSESRSGWCTPGAPAHGVFESYGTAGSVTKAGFLAAAAGLHRAWERAPLVMASAVPPAIGA